MIRNQQGKLTESGLQELNASQRRSQEALRLERIRAGSEDIDRPLHSRNQGDFFHMLGGFVNDIVCCQPDLKGWNERQRVEARRNSKTAFQVKQHGDLPADKAELDALHRQWTTNSEGRAPSSSSTQWSTQEDFFHREISKQSVDNIEITDGVA